MAAEAKKLADQGFQSIRFSTDTPRMRTGAAGRIYQPGDPGGGNHEGGPRGGGLECDVDEPLGRAWRRPLSWAGC